MSQSKVEQRKYEKKHRAEIAKKQKRKKILNWCIFGVFVGCILAATLGVKIYKAIPKYIEVDKLNAYVSQVWAENGYGDYFSSDDASETDADEDDSDDEEDEE